MFGRRFRTKTPRQILNELDILYNLGWRGPVFFVDDSFTGIPKRTKEFLNELIPWIEARKYPFELRTQAVASLSKDDELLGLMVKSGFVSVIIGFETTDVSTLEYTKKFHNLPIDMDAACRKINKAGIAIFASFVIGFDNETPGADKRIIDFITRNNIPELLLSPLLALPGADLWRRLEREGRLYPDSIDFTRKGRLHNFVPARPLEQIAQEMINVYRVVYDPEAFLKRATNHILSMDARQWKSSFNLPGIRQLSALLGVLFRHGVVYPSRWTFWKSLFKVVVKRRDRLMLFLHYSFFVREFFDFRNTGVKDLLAQ